LAAAEVYRNADRGCRAITFPEMTTYLGLPSIHDPAGYWDPLFRACDETGTVICMHIGSGSRMTEVSTYAPKAVELTIVCNAAQTSMAEWLVSGILVRYPRLKICYAESQIGWLPYVLERLDKCAQRSFGGVSPLVEDPPSSYMAGRVYGCFFDDDHGIANRDKIGVSQLLFETDYPHQDTTWPNTPAVVEHMATQMPASDLERIVRGNAIDLFGLPATIEGVPDITCK
jgi:predicted TIM-barrel fold metal-dependent hydrolase